MPLSLDDKAIALALPFLHENGIELELNAVDLLRLPSSQSKDVVIERTASVGTDVEVPAMLLYLADDILRAGTAVGPESVHTDTFGFQKGEESLMGVCLIKADVCIAIAVLNLDNLVTDNINSWSIAEEFLVRRFCIILLSFKELMVEIHIVCLRLIQFTGRNQGVYK